MRTELEKIELIEKYLLKQLDAEELQQMEWEMEKDPSFKKEVEQQKQLMDGINKQAFKDVSSKAYKKYKFTKKLWQWGIGGALTVLALGVIIPLSVNISNGDAQNKIENVMAADSLSADETHLKIQHFSINTAKDTVVETDGGIVLSIPAGGFTDADGNVIDGEIELVVKEALSASEIISAGLSTTANGKLLETGGMFYVNAFANSKELKIKKAIYAQVPTDEVKPGMMLFSGEKTADGRINWVNPKPLEKWLVPVEITSLDFYPKDYEPTLAREGYGDKNKAWKDSMYYSFAYISNCDTSNLINNNGEKIFKSYCSPCHDWDRRLTAPALKGVVNRIQPGKYGDVDSWLDAFIRDNSKVRASGDVYSNKMYAENGGAMPQFNFSEKEMKDLISFLHQGPSSNSPLTNKVVNIGETYYSDSFGSVQYYTYNSINPAKIKAIWNSKFNNTLLATKEFEERLKVIFNTCDYRILDLYVDNIDKNLWEIDSMAAKKYDWYGGLNPFLEFAKRKDGKVKINDAQVKALSKYYRAKTLACQQAAKETQEKFRKEQHKLDAKYYQKSGEKVMKDYDALNKNFNAEYEKNLDEVNKKLGIKTSRIAKLSYTTSITNTGWNNVDKYVFEATATRTSTEITYNGKTATITYSPINVEVKNKSQYDRVYSYLLTEELYSFQRMNDTTNGFKEKLNGFMTYNLAVVAYKGDSIFYFQQKALPKEGGTTVANLSPVTQGVLQEALHGLTQHSKQKDILEDLKFGVFKAENEKRQKDNKKMEELRMKIFLAVFPCGIAEGAH
ncbi:MAG: cytochrome c [Bacteroidetes bacterium]|nr:cytochrome c [Bacteroidota bacterium]